MGIAALSDLGGVVPDGNVGHDDLCAFLETDALPSGHARHDIFTEHRLIKLMDEFHRFVIGRSIDAADTTLDDGRVTINHDRASRGRRRVVLPPGGIEHSYRYEGAADDINTFMRHLGSMPVDEPQHSKC